MHVQLLMFAAVGTETAFFDKSFFQSLVGNGLANVLAVVLGIPAGLYVDRLISSRGSDKQRTQMKAALKRAIQHNLGTLATIRDQIANNAAPTFGLDLALLDATSQSKYETLDDIDLCANIDHLRFELDHLDRQVDSLLRLELDSGAKSAVFVQDGAATSLYSRAHPQIVNNIQVRLEPLETECKALLARLGD
jgi:hypothetical protein